MTENNEEIKNSEAEVAETAAPVVEKKTRKRRTPKKSAIDFEFSDKDVADFKAWKESKRGTGEVRVETAEVDPVYAAWKEESRLVKGIFRCREPEGGNVKFAFKKYKWDQVKWYTLFDGETYEIPLAVARHLNNNCSYPIHSHILGADGKPSVDRLGRMKSRMNFESTEFAIA